MNKIEEFINFVIELADEELEDFFDGSSRRYFVQGGCFEFAKILKNYIKGSKIVINKDNDHCGIAYSGSIYDAKGKVDKVKDFKVANIEDIKYMESRFGIPEKTYINGKRISDYLIEEIKNCNIDKLINSLEGEER